MGTALFNITDREGPTACIEVRAQFNERDMCEEWVLTATIGDLTLRRAFGELDAALIEVAMIAAAAAEPIEVEADGFLKRPSIREVLHERLR